MKIGLITDIHFRGVSPENRIDDFYQSIIEKFEESLAIFKKNKCELILDAGDMLHSPIVSLTICDDIIDIINKYKIQVHALYGNHCLLNGHIENSKSTTLTHMFKRCDYFNRLVEVDCSKDNFKIPTLIKGYEYYHGIESDIKEKGLFHNSENYLTIAVVHAMITEKKLMDSVLHIPYQELKTNYDFVFLGHNHHEIGIQKVGDATIIGLGALARLTADKKDYMRKPKVAILDTETKKVEVVELKSAKPYADVFNLEIINQKKEVTANLDCFVKALQETKIQSLDTLGIIKEIATQHNVDKEVIDEIIKRISDSED